MNENIDVRMANYLTILGNPMLSRNFDPNDINAMQRALAIYVSKTARAYVRAAEEEDTVRKDVFSGFSNSHEKLNLK